MMTEEKKRGRKPSVPDHARVLNFIYAGHYDEYLGRFDEAIEARRDSLREKVMEEVRNVFGPDAQVVTDGKAPVPVQSSENPFVRKAEGESTEVEAPAPTDPLGDLDEVEQQMTEEGGLLSRGATINGLHSSQIN
jgi:hypothetical protein